MATINYNDAAFRQLFPALSNVTTFPQALIQAYWDLATSYITNNTWSGWYAGFNLLQQTNALNLMTAHLLAVNTAAASGQPGGVLTGATIDKISVQMQPPPAPNQWQWWLNQSPYGQQLLALLQVGSAGGRFFTAGRPVVSAFRR